MSCLAAYGSRGAAVFKAGLLALDGLYRVRPPCIHDCPAVMSLRLVFVSGGGGPLFNFDASFIWSSEAAAGAAAAAAAVRWRRRQWCVWLRCWAVWSGHAARPCALRAAGPALGSCAKGSVSPARCACQLCRPPLHLMRRRVYRTRTGIRLQLYGVARIANFRGLFDVRTIEE
jgi:hypothetical protein